MHLVLLIAFSSIVIGFMVVTALIRRSIEQQLDQDPEVLGHVYEDEDAETPPQS